MRNLKKIQIILYRNPTHPEILLLKRRGQHPVWQGITGGVEDTDASLQDAAIRELNEELSIQTTEDTIVGPIYSFEFKTDRKGFEGTMAQEFCFAYEIQPEYTIHLSSEHEEYVWLSLEKAIEKIDFDTSKFLVKKIGELLRTNSI